jgi:hypothetical protein
MTNTWKTVGIVAGVAVGAYVLLELVKGRATSTQLAPPAPRPSDVSWMSGLLQFGTSIVNAVATSGPTAPAGNPYGNYDPTWNTTGIDPSTGGVVIPEGATYGPPSPSGSGSLR